MLYHKMSKFRLKRTIVQKSRLHAAELTGYRAMGIMSAICRSNLREFRLKKNCLCLSVWVCGELSSYFGIRSPVSAIMASTR